MAGMPGANGQCGGGRPLLIDRYARLQPEPMRARWRWGDFAIAMAVVVISGAIGFWVGRITAPVGEWERPVFVVSGAKWL